MFLNSKTYFDFCQFTVAYIFYKPNHNIFFQHLLLQPVIIQDHESNVASIVFACNKHILTHQNSHIFLPEQPSEQRRDCQTHLRSFTYFSQKWYQIIFILLCVV